MKIFTYLGILGIFLSLAAPVFSGVPESQEALGVISQNSVSVGTSEGLVVSRNNARGRLIIQNTSGVSTLRYKFGSTFVNTQGVGGIQEGFSVAPGYILDLPIKDSVYAKSTGASTILNVYEFIK